MGPLHPIFTTYHATYQTAGEKGSCFTVFFLNGDPRIHWKDIGGKSQIREWAESPSATVTEMDLASQPVKTNSLARHSLEFSQKSLNRMPAKQKAASHKCSSANHGYLFNGELELSLMV